jgi:hypothetical protein
VALGPVLFGFFSLCEEEVAFWWRKIEKGGSGDPKTGHITNDPEWAKGSKRAKQSV